MATATREALLETIEQTPTIDTHEHLPPESVRLEQNPDFSTFFSHYCQDDLVAAGMAQSDLARFFAPDVEVEEKWRLFEPWYRWARDGSYCRASAIATQRFYGIGALESLDDAVALTDAVRRANTPGLYRRVLRDACNVRRAVNYDGDVVLNDDLFATVVFVTHYAEASLAAIRSLEQRTGIVCGTLAAYVDAVRQDLASLRERGCRGYKFHFAYMRDLAFAPRTHAEAEAAFLRVTEEGHGWRTHSIGYEEARVLQDYMVHRVVEYAGEVGLPVVFHASLQARTGHNPDDARPLRLWNLANRFPRTRIVVLHAGLPWMEDAALLAKQYPNVYLDMGWTHLMSPEISTRALATWIDLVPMNKVFGFGGDYSVIEKVYGHLTLARRDIARALAARVDAGDLTMARARAWIQAILHDNPAEVYQLEPDRSG